MSKYRCCERGNDDDATMYLIKDAPWVIECGKCGHPNDARWDYDEVYYDNGYDPITVYDVMD